MVISLRNSRSSLFNHKRGCGSFLSKTMNGENASKQLSSKRAALLQPPCEFILHNYAEIKRDEREWFSKAFYTSLNGYKMCIGVFPSGNGEGRGTHISLFVHLMKGENDSELKWPFRGSVVIELLNQQADHTHHRRTIFFNSHAPAEVSERLSSSTPGERVELGWGHHKFIPHSRLGHKNYCGWISDYECQYLKDNSLRFRVIKVVSTGFYS